jgi:uncharacterized protein (DUF2384 family)
MKLRFLALLPLIATCVFAQTPGTLAPLPPDGFVTLDQVVQDFTQQPDAALQKYNGMRILVYGRIGQVTHSDDAEGDPLTVYLQQPNNITPDVKCVFTNSGVPQSGDVVVKGSDEEADFFHRNQQGDITSERPIDIVGQNVGIRGTFDNFVAGDVILKDCRKVRAARLNEILAQHGISTE